MKIFIFVTTVRQKRHDGVLTAYLREVTGRHEPHANGPSSEDDGSVLMASLHDDSRQDGRRPRQSMVFFFSGL